MFAFKIRQDSFCVAILMLTLVVMGAGEYFTSDYYRSLVERKNYEKHLWPKTEFRFGDGPVLNSHFKKIDAAPNLCSIMFNNSNITDSDLDRLADNPRIVHITFRNVPNLTDAAVEKLARLPNLTQIIFDQAPQLRTPNFAALANCKKLKKLELKRCAYLTSEGFADLANCGANITELSFETCPVDDDALARLRKLQRLESIELSDCPAVTDMGLAYLAKYKRLNSVKLECCPGITDSGIKQLSRSRRLRFLELVACSKINREFAESLGSMKLAVNFEEVKKETFKLVPLTPEVLPLNSGSDGKDVKPAPLTDANLKQPIDFSKLKKLEFKSGPAVADAGAGN